MIFSMISSLLWWVVTIGLILFVVSRFRKREEGTHSRTLQQRFLHHNNLREMFFLYSVAFLGMSLFAMNRDFGDITSWRVILLITSLIGLSLAYKFHVLSAQLSSLIAIVFWWIFQGYAWLVPVGQSYAMAHTGLVRPVILLSGLLLIGVLYYVLGVLHEKTPWRKFQHIFSVLGLTFITGILFICSFKFGLEMLVQLSRGTDFTASWEVFIVWGMILVGVLATAIYAWMKKMLANVEIIGIILYIGVALFFLSFNTLILFTGVYGYSPSGPTLTQTGVLYAILFNGLLFLHLIGVLLLGYVKKEVWLINLGAFLLFIFTISKYFDWFFTFLDKSLFFISAGLLLFGVGWFMEKGRRYMVESIQEEEAHGKA